MLHIRLLDTAAANHIPGNPMEKGVMKWSFGWYGYTRKRDGKSDQRQRDNGKGPSLLKTILPA
jgi:hypothetical protein